ncbi:flagellin [Desulfuribacillus alkaliarsenatis]|uniref:Flagellin n=1 Tax=Desulfuribacillus alkaliarsenatis TaxID=766136 RepID=A0A1E5G416_9FIRM|nr:flagellin [Desulfuribacillus alkaliarsenatis]OEF97822.1 hypothetical protein BHF68_13395 [Desulfuribacillus alkaliarsenatis]
MRINNNIQALNSYNQLNKNQFRSSKNLEKLSSGLRINRASDDAAGLAISEKMRGQIRGLQMAERNALDGVSLLQTTEGALTEVHAMLQRMRELAVQAANDTNTDSDRAEIQKEIDQLLDEIDEIKDKTEFNTRKLLNGESSVNVGIDSTTKGDGIMSVRAISPKVMDGDYEVLVGPNTSPASVATVLTSKINKQGAGVNSNETDLIATTGAHVGIGKENLLGEYRIEVKNFVPAVQPSAGPPVIAGSHAQALIEVYDPNGTLIGTRQGSVGDDVSGAPTAAADVVKIEDNDNPEIFIEIDARLIKMAGTINVQVELELGMQLQKDGEDITPATKLKTHNGLLQAAGFEMEFKGFDDTLGFYETEFNVGNNALNFQIGPNSNQLMRIDVEEISNVMLGIQDTKVTTNADANNAIRDLDRAIVKVSSLRSKLGAVQNRLEHTLNNLSTTRENLTAAESRIRDADMALEMTEFTRNNILNQASTAMLAQANQLPQGVLQLLQ